MGQADASCLRHAAVGDTLGPSAGRAMFLDRQLSLRHDKWRPRSATSPAGQGLSWPSARAQVRGPTAPGQQADKRAAQQPSKSDSLRCRVASAFTLRKEVDAQRCEAASPGVARPHREYVDR